jgi:hypothetical protein
MRHSLLILFISMFCFSAFAQEAEFYDCVFTDVGAELTDKSKDTVYLEDAFSVSENMRMGSVVLKPLQTPTRIFQSRVYQFLLPDNQRYIQMWYANSDFHVDVQMSVSSDNSQVIATFNQDLTHRPLACYKN